MTLFDFCGDRYVDVVFAPDYVTASRVAFYGEPISF